jgi:hypothetical protein
MMNRGWVIVLAIWIVLLFFLEKIGEAVAHFFEQAYLRLRWLLCSPSGNGRRSKTQVIETPMACGRGEEQ